MSQYQIHYRDFYNGRFGSRNKEYRRHPGLTRRQNPGHGNYETFFVREEQRAADTELRLRRTYLQYCTGSTVPNWFCIQAKY